MKQRIYSSRKIYKHCRMCEEKMFSTYKDGLCTSCHMELCRKDNCSRCWHIANDLLKFTAREIEGND